MGRMEKATEAEKSDRLRREGEKGERDSERAGGAREPKCLPSGPGAAVARAEANKV